MKRLFALLLLTMLSAGPAASLAYGGGHSGGRGGGHVGGGHFTGGHVGDGHGIGFAGARGARDIVRAGPGVPVPVVRPTIRGRVAVVAAPVVVGGSYYYYTSYGYPYYDSYPYAYYPPDYSTYAPPPTYIEQPPEVRYYCADLRDYYPNVTSCPSPWMKVLPDDGGYPR